MPHIDIRAASLDSEDAQKLILGLNAELSERYPEPGMTHFRLDRDEVGPGRGVFLVAYVDGAAAGCGAVRLLDEDEAEIKRMYVVPESRGRGIAAGVLAELETQARGLGARRLVLETGVRQAEALALYRRAGFGEIPRFGEYVNSTLSICMAKDLD